MAAFEREEIEKLLMTLEDQGALFPEFVLAREENGLRILGAGGSSLVYEMASRSNHQTHYALKVMGLQPHMSSFGDFQATAMMQRLLVEQTDYVVRILAVKKLWLQLTEAGDVCGIWETDPPENEDKCLHLQLMLMDKLESILTRNRFGKITLRQEALTKEAEVLKLGFQIGQALICAHKNQILHRDIKLENIFWDPRENCYKLGDFGAAKHTQSGSAETLIYSNGYGAPEIQRVLTETYDGAADMYSLGITLYLLLNNLKFPGSDGYHYREIQYHPDFTFPVPENASEAVARVLRKMCAYRKSDRYGSVTEAMTALAEAAQPHAAQWENPDWMDMPTETYREETPVFESRTERKGESRAARILRKRAAARSSKWENALFLVAFGVLFYFAAGIFAADSLSLAQWQFWLFPAALVLGALFRIAGGLAIPAGIVAGGMVIWSGICTGFSMLHVLALVYLLAGMQTPLISMAAAVCLWVFLPPEQLGLAGLVQQDWGWFLLIILLALSHRAAIYPQDGKIHKTTVYKRGYALMSWLPFLLVGIGVFFWLRHWICKIPIPEILQFVYPIRTGLCGYIVYVVQYMVWGIIEQEETEERKTK